MPRVLIADDDTLIRALLRQVLEYGGYDVVDAVDGAQAVDRLQRGESYDVVVTDYNMPGASGLDVIKAAHRIDPNLPCVIVTAFRDMDLAMDAMQEGAVGFIPKPFKPAHLLTVVQRAHERGSLAIEAVHLRLLAPMLERFTMLLANAVEAKDHATQQHCERLVTMAGRLGEALALPEREMEVIRLGAALHDIGKISMPEYLLRKAERLTHDEFDLMRRHPEVGAAILENIDAWKDVRLIVRHHHERFDGAGYPDRIQGSAIPLGARIVAVVDSFDVMRRGRPYSPPKRLEAIISELLQLRGKQFDPDCVDAFLPVLADSERDIELIGSEAPSMSLDHLLGDINVFGPVPGAEHPHRHHPLPHFHGA